MKFSQRMIRRESNSCQLMKRGQGQKESAPVHGDPAMKILERSKIERCDCAVLGKTGRSRVKRMLVGSVADKVSKLSRIPVIMVK